jgi:hypothetical protein
MKRTAFKSVLALSAAGVVGIGCTPDTPTSSGPLGAPEASTILAAKHAQPPASAHLLTSGLAGSSGSAIGPGGALFVPEGGAGRISRVDPETGDVTTFAEGLPPAIFPIGGVVDVAFLGGTAYALVSFVGPDVGGSDVVGIYRMEGPDQFSIFADLGAFNMANPPTIEFDYDFPTGVLYAIEPYRGGFLVTDGHLNRVLHVTPQGEVSVFRAFGNTVPTGLAVAGNTVYMAEAGEVPHAPEDGKVLAFTPQSTTPWEVASGAPLLVDVGFGRGQTLFALAHGTWDGAFPGSSALENTGSLVRVTPDGGFVTVIDELDRPTSFQFIGNNAYVVTLTGEVWRISNVAGPPFGSSR